MLNFKLENTTVCHHTDRAHVTITLKCNNNCLFCLQGHHPFDKHRCFEDIISEIDVASKNYVDKIILSGGEPTIHPDFLRLIKYCKIKGFKQIQVISNGRMFSILEFVKQAYKAGLTEVTLSIHGKDSETHDYLVNSQGAFNQILKAITNLKKYNFLISVDVGIFSKNYNQLPEIIKMIHHDLDLKGDIDLIGPIMNGSAFENRKDIMPNYKLVEPYLKKALDYVKQNNLVCWVLRVPLKYMVGYEVYKQDNNKLVEKSLSLESILQKFPPDCFGEKCDYCRMNYICKKLIEINNIMHGNKKGEIRIVIDTESQISSKDVFQNHISRINFKISEFIFLVNPSVDILNIVLDSDININRIIIKNLFDNKLINYINKINLNHNNKKIILQYDFVNLNSKLSNLFNVDINQLSSISFLFEEKNIDAEANLIINKQNFSDLVGVVNLLIARNIKKINFTNFNPYDFLKRDISWETGIKILDESNVVMNLFLLENNLEEATLLCKKNNIAYSINEIPFCVFSDKFLQSHKLNIRSHDFLSTITLDFLDNNKLNFPNYIKYVYNTIYKERIKQCDDCVHNKKCAGFDDMYLKLYSLNKK